MIYNIESIEGHLKQALKEFSQFSFGEDGIILRPVFSTQNCVQFDGGEAIIFYTTVARLIYSLFLFDAQGYVGQTDCQYDDMAVMLDMSRNAVRTVNTTKEYMRYSVLMGYTSVHLYMEDVYEVPEEPYFGYRRGRYSQNELKEIVDYGRMLGLEVIPSIQTLGHLQQLSRWRRFEKIMDTDFILLAEEEETYQLISDMLKSLQECFRTEKINLGMDEAHMVGLGKYLDKHGYTNRSSIVVRHLHKVCEIAGMHGFSKPMMWNDTFIRLANQGNFENGQVPEEVLKLVPENITLCAWNYLQRPEKVYVDILKKQQMFNRPVYFAGGANCWNGFTPQNKYAFKQTHDCMKACKKVGVKNFIMTLWGDDGAECSLYACLPVVAYGGAIANGRRDYKALFKAMTGVAFDKFMQLDEPNDISVLNDPFAQITKYMFYNDPFQGLFDCTVNLEDGKKFKGIALRFARLAKHQEWGYIFDTQAKLAKLLEVKYSIGVRTRNAYLAGDKATLQQLVDKDYKLIIKRLDDFYNAFRTQWQKENKAYGFEVQDHRIGGVRARVLHCKRTLQEYLDGKIERIEELEDPVLNVLCDPNADGKSIWYPNITKWMISANVVSVV